MADSAINTENVQMVGSQGDYVVILLPRPRMTKAEALLQAAWLVACAMPEDGEFERVLAAVFST